VENANEDRADYTDCEKRGGVLGGEIGELDTGQYSHALLYGGRIASLYSHQLAATPTDKHIDLFCKSHLFNSGTGMLTGTWGDDETFSIRLVNVAGYTATIDNIDFHTVPEPVSLGLLAG